MEVLFGIVGSACLAYLIGEVNSIQTELKSLRESVIWIQTKLDRRKKEDE